MHASGKTRLTAGGKTRLTALHASGKTRLTALHASGKTRLTALHASGKTRLTALHASGKTRLTAGGKTAGGKTHLTAGASDGRRNDEHSLGPDRLQEGRHAQPRPRLTAEGMMCTAWALSDCRRLRRALAGSTLTEEETKTTA
ncbi:hypothetical protein NDU88_011270 [Pleurodeles waltl]|uniref:Uncharacterized protein n=1 Tax=Pleurodeles waltl TaxID=8319 RepID=A0AAV7Q0C9_PLEWA|nr:hypothetical protein NDU88_011270 [Pleurodeles waltl]